jgi:hypothetical protein
MGEELCTQLVAGLQVRPRAAAAAGLQTPRAPAAGAAPAPPGPGAPAAGPARALGRAGHPPASCLQRLLHRHPKLKAAQQQLLYDALAVASGLRPAAMLDYVRVTQQQLAQLVQALAQAGAAQGERPPARLLMPGPGLLARSRTPAELPAARSNAAMRTGGPTSSPCWLLQCAASAGEAAGTWVRSTCCCSGPGCCRTAARPPAWSASAALAQAWLCPGWHRLTAPRCAAADADARSSRFPQAARSPCQGPAVHLAAVPCQPSAAAWQGPADPPPPLPPS